MSVVKLGMLLLAVLPTVAALAIWGADTLRPGETAIGEAPFWPVVVAQLAAVGLFSRHAFGNRRLEPGEAYGLAWQFLILIPWGMLRYWWAQVWPEGH